MNSPTKINIPKLDANQWHEVKVVFSKCARLDKSVRVILKKQIIAGLKIKSGTEIYCPIFHNESSALDAAYGDTMKIAGWKINELLKHLYLQELRNKKP